MDLELSIPRITIGFSTILSVCLTSGPKRRKEMSETDKNLKISITQ
jgi:hypothetical protein